jgi:hypothetical protein
MRSNRIGLILCIIAGSFCVYCGQSAMTMLGHNHGVDGGTPRDGSSFAADALGQSSGGTCCTAPGRETPTVIFDDVVKPAPIAASANCTWMSPVFDVSGYRTIVVHTPYRFLAQFRNGKAGFVAGAIGEGLPYGANGNSVPRAVQLDPILGHDMRINFGTVTATDPDGGDLLCSATPVALTIVGYRNP